MNTKTKKYHKVLSIAGSDSGGGAGIQADLKAISANGCYGMTAITAITAQNTLGVQHIHPVPVDSLRMQIEAVMSDLGADAIKIGMLHSVEVIETVADCLKKYPEAKVVLDPVMVATSGDKLLQDDAIESLVSLLFPLADVITPNLPEAELLLDREISDLNMMQSAVIDLTGIGAKSALLKAGHMIGEQLIDLFYQKETRQMLALESNFVDTNNTHGTGCTLSSAIAAWLARGYDLSEAVQHGKAYIEQAIIEGRDYDIGRGHGPVHHFYDFWK